MKIDRLPDSESTLKGPKTMVTYRMADGELVYGEYAHVSDLEYFDDTDEPVTIIHELWERVQVETLQINPPGWDETDD